MSLEGRSLITGERVRHQRFGIGSVRLDEGITAIVRFEHGVEECEKSALELVPGLQQAINSPTWHAPLEVISRVQAAAIESVNDLWGVLSCSRIALLPHQLWVCRRVLETWPTRWLVADDVGLGKTIEAGLILWPLLARGTVKRLLIICPASLVEQWQYRLRTMFDIRVAIYSADADTQRADFWGTHNHIIASLHTVRLDRDNRHQRLLESEPWDLVIVDEAHHLNADEKAGPTLGFELVEKLVEQNRVASMVFFTGTPHRGKNFGFISLLSLLRPGLFDPKEPLRANLKHLREVMIRNNKQNVTDLKGQRLFYPPLVQHREFVYSGAEEHFYQMLTDFIITGKAYASSLEATEGKAVQLVLIAMQKLASSSVAAIHRALRGRLQRIQDAPAKLEDFKAEREIRSSRLTEIYEELEKTRELDEISRLEEKIVKLSDQLRLMENEEPWLQELVAAAAEVGEETKIKKIVSIAKNEFANRQVLFFTEYKATQSLLMSALIREFGDQCVTFINGDDRADEVVIRNGEEKSFTESRETAADRFNAAEVQFLVSTEAGGEGIDLQETCFSLVHVDLPWNPMRLHQRVGRLNRYGQTRQVEIFMLRNPQTVESRIWDKLNEKMQNIMAALGHAMDEPEDLLQIVLGMTSPSLWRELFVDGQEVPAPKLSAWFDQKTATFGGIDVIETVRTLVGQCAKFDFQEVGDQLPGIDLIALSPFFVSMLKMNRRRVDENDGFLSFITPDDWRREPGIYSSYDRMHFDRNNRQRDSAQKLLGVGHKLMNQALRQAKEITASVVSLPTDVLPFPILVYRIVDKVTGETRTVRSVVVGVEAKPKELGGEILLRDWELLKVLNALIGARGLRIKNSAPPEELNAVLESVNLGVVTVQSQFRSLDLPFKIPDIEPIAAFWPVSADAKGEEITEIESRSDDTGKAT